MRKLPFATAVAIGLVSSGITTVFAQDEAPPNFVPIEMMACVYKDRQDRGDFDNAMNQMIRWMQDNNSLPYAAWHLEKVFTGPDREFDFLYVGAWPDGAVMGRDITQYRATAADEIEAFEEVAECPANLLYASLNTKAPPEGDLQASDVIITMSDCKVAEGRKTSDAMAAVRKYGEYRTENGSAGGTWLWFSAFGGGDGDFSFKLINSHTNLEAFGDYFKWIVDNQAYQVSGDLYEGLLDCDTARAYMADNIINTLAPPE